MLWTKREQEWENITKAGETLIEEMVVKKRNLYGRRPCLHSALSLAQHEVVVWGFCPYVSIFQGRKRTSLKRLLAMHEAKGGWSSL